MRKILVLMATMALSIAFVSAQDYNWAIGVRAGGQMSGVSVKHRLSASSAIEGLLAVPYKGGFGLTALYQRYVPVIGDGFNFYYGAGAHLGQWDDRFMLGVDGVIGLEYSFRAVPLALSLDYKPMLTLVENTKLRLLDFGFGIKVTL